MKNFLALFLALSFAASSQVFGGEKPTSAKQNTQILPPSELKFTPRPKLKGKQTGELEMRFSYDVERTGEYDPESRLELNNVYERIYTPDGETLFYGRLYGYIKPPLYHPQKQIVKFIKSGQERWIEIDFYHADGMHSGTLQLCLWDDINVEVKEAFDEGNVAGLYKSSNRFDVMLGIFSDNNNFSYSSSGKPRQKHFITVRSGPKEDYYENYDENGAIDNTSYQKDTVFIWIKTFYPNGRLKSVNDYENRTEREYDERGRIIRDENF